MAIHNTAYDAANTAVRAFLTEIGSYYFGQKFNTGSGEGKLIWIKIRDELFQGRCAYCGIDHFKLQIEHLIMFNRVEFGLHHPGNVVPVCSDCNKRSKNLNGYNSWEEHLTLICASRNQEDKFAERRLRIHNHINEGEFKYPCLNNEESHALRIITNNLYESVKSEFLQAVSLFEDLNKAYNNR